MIISRRTFLGGLLVAPAVAMAQQAPRTRHVGILFNTNAIAQKSYLEALRAGLKRVGYVEGVNLTLEIRGAEGRYERGPELVRDLVQLKVDAIVTGGTPMSVAVRKHATGVPAVSIGASDPVAAGLVESLARPGGNMTGLIFFFPEMCAKRLELLKETLPTIQRVGYFINPANETYLMAAKAMEATASTLRLSLVQVPVAKVAEFEQAFSELKKQKVQALAYVDEPLFNFNPKPLAGLAAKTRMPMIARDAHVQAGALMSYGVDISDLWFRAGLMLDKIFRGAKPAEMPIERATKFDMAVNLRAARTLGFAIPQSVLLRADRVIE